jgi:hypothetical protein
MTVVEAVRLNWRQTIDLLGRSSCRTGEVAVKSEFGSP